MIVEGAALVALAILAGFVWQQYRRPKYLLSLQKTTNSASQPEVASITANLPARRWWGKRVTEQDLWHELEAMGLAETARMVTVNEMILDHTRAMTDRIAAERPTLKNKALRKLEKRRREYAARTLGIPVDQVTDEHLAQLIGQAQAQAQQNASAPGAE